MNEKSSQIIEQINAIKLKLIKYSSLKSYDKVNEYLHNLGRFQLNDEILTSTQIMNLLKDLKNKENPAYSTKVGDLMKKIKNDLIARASKPTDQNKSRPQQNTSASKPNDSKTMAKSENKNVSNKSNEINNKSSLKPNVNQQTRKESANTSSTTKPSTNSNSSKTNSTNNLVKKRPSTAPNETKGNSLDESNSKKPKLSLSDYKLLKGGSSDSSKSESNDTNRGSTSSSSSQYEVDSDFNQFDNYSPTPKNVLDESKSNQSRSGSSLSKKDKNIIIPPVPSIPLTNLFSNDNRIDVFEPVKPTSMLNSSSNGMGSSGMKNSISKYTSSLINATSKVDNEPSTDDMLAQIMRQKGSHKQILYTGKRNVNGQSAHVSKLFDLCVKVLTDTLDELPNRISIYNTTHDFPIAFDLIKPVLERANAKQLETCEYYSPNLLEESDYIWQKICEREFRKLEPPEEDESWRELYFRKLDERDREFERARQLISSKQQAKPKERQTQMATVKFLSANKVVRNVVRIEPTANVRTIATGSGSSIKKSSSAQVGTSRFAPAQPMSQGRKAIMKLIKKSTRR